MSVGLLASADYPHLRASDPWTPDGPRPQTIPLIGSADNPRPQKNLQITVRKRTGPQSAHHWRLTQPLESNRLYSSLWNDSFLSRVSIQTRDIDSKSVCPPVRPLRSDILWKQYIVIISSPHGSSIILVFRVFYDYQTSSRNSDGVIPFLGVKYKWLMGYNNFAIFNQQVAISRKWYKI